MYPYLRLEDPGLAPLVIAPDNGFVGQTLDLGDAVVREVVQNAPDADGTIDTSAFVGARNITLNVVVDGAVTDVWSAVNTLRAFTHPRRRPTMFVQMTATAPMQQVTLRGSQWSDPIGGEGNATGLPSEDIRSITVQWVAPYGILESAALTVVTVSASGAGNEGGRPYDKTYDVTYAGGTVIGETTVVALGTSDAWPLLRVYGPCVDPVIRNQTTGKQLAFVGLTINAGEFLEIDTRARTILYNGDPANGRYTYLVFTTSEWWPIVPGVNVIRFTPASYSPPSNLEISYHDAWL